MMLFAGIGFAGCPAGGWPCRDSLGTAGLSCDGLIALGSMISSGWPSPGTQKSASSSSIDIQPRFLQSHLRTAYPLRSHQMSPWALV